MDKVLLLGGSGSESPLSGISTSVHDDSLGLGDNTVIAGSDIGGSHLGNSQSNSFTLGGDQNDFLADLRIILELSEDKIVYFNVRFESKDTRNHKLGTVADGINTTVLDDNSGISGQEGFHGEDGLSEVAFVL